MTTELRVPQALWETVLDMFAQHPPGVERVVYLDGFRVDETGYPRTSPDDQIFIATTISVPDAILRPRNYVVPAVAVSAAGSHLRTERMTRVAQIHTHGNGWIDHSSTDDDHAYSQQLGAISVVVPFHGATRPELLACAIHVRRTGGWQRENPESVIRIIPTVLDHRSTKWNPPPNGDTSSRFRAWVRKVLRRPAPSK